MGRQAYLTRLALGRSAFEPPSQENVPTEARPFPESDYVQLYNERGHPINPQARAYGRRLRKAQNDVLAAIGVVTRSSPWEDSPDSLQRRIQRLSRLEEEDSAGSTIALLSTLLGNLCTWWIGSLRYRILTFSMTESTPFVDLIASEYRASGPSMLYSGFPARLLSTIAVQASVYIALVFRPLDRFLIWTGASRKTKLSLQRFKLPLEICIRLFFDVMFCPLAYHASLQRLNLVPARSLLPPWRAFIPSSSLSPIYGVSIPASLMVASIANVLHSAARSPSVFICAEHFWERWVYGTIYEAVESSTIRPENPDLTSQDDDFKTRATAVLGLRRRSPPYIRTAIHQLLTNLGWASPLQPTTAETPSRGRENSSEIDQLEQVQSIEINNIEINEITPLNLPRAHSGIQPVPEVDGATTITSSHLPLQVHSEPLSPISPTGSVTGQDPNDPRIRITSREDVIEMEVRLPSRVSPSSTGLPQSHPSNYGREDVAPSISPPRPRGARVSHRVTQLSSEPANMLGEALKAQIVIWATLPLKLITLRLVASHYYANHSYDVRAFEMKPMRAGMFGVGGGLDRLSWRSIGMFMSRVALCGAMEMAIDLALWGCQWAVITWTGKRFYNWGSL